MFLFSSDPGLANSKPRNAEGNSPEPQDERVPIATIVESELSVGMSGENHPPPLEDSTERSGREMYLPPVVPSAPMFNGTGVFVNDAGLIYLHVTNEGKLCDGLNISTM